MILPLPPNKLPDGRVAVIVKSYSASIPNRPALSRCPHENVGDILEYEEYLEATEGSEPPEHAQLKERQAASFDPAVRSADELGIEVLESEKC